MSRIELMFPLSPAECTARLAACVPRTRSVYCETKPKPVYGDVWAGWVSIRKRAPRNPFEVHLSGTFAARGPVTVFRGRTGRDATTWFALAVLVTWAVSMLVALSVLATGRFPAVSLFMLLVMLLLVVGLTLHIRREWHKTLDEGAFLVEFLTRTLGGTVCATERAPARVARDLGRVPEGDR